MKDKTIREILFGVGSTVNKPKGRSSTMTFGAAKDGEKYRRYNYRNDDGFILTLIEMIEALEDRIKLLEKKKK